MFGTIRKHQSWLWVLIIALMSISMVVFFSSDVSLTGRGSRDVGDLGSINGVPIEPTEYLNSMQEVKLSYLLHYGKLPDNDENGTRSLERETISRVFLLKKLKEMNITASDKAVALLMNEQIRDNPLDGFEREYLAPNGLSKGDYTRYVRNEAGIRQLAAAAAANARLVSPREAENLYRKDHQEVAVELALFWASNYVDKVVITNGAIGAHYTNWLGQYMIPERTVIGYVEFHATNFFAEADKELSQRTNLTALLDEEYIKRGGTNFFKNTNGVPMTEVEGKAKLKDEFRKALGYQAARRTASEFGTALIDVKPDPNKIENFDKLAAAKGFPIKFTKPFDAVAGLEEFDDEKGARTEESVRDVIRKEAGKLTEVAPIRFNPIPGTEAIYLIARKGKIPRELPPLEKVQTKVTNDFRKFVSQELARKAGQSFHTNLTNGLAQKKSFDALCAAEKVLVVKVPPFSLATESITNLDSRINPRMLKNLAMDLEPGKVTPFLPFSQEGGLILHLKDRPKLDDAVVQAGLPAFMGTMRQFRHNEAFNQWFRKQAESAKLSGPKRETTIGAPN